VRLDRLQLRNFRRFRSCDLEFPDGVIGIVGRNGAGKSTIVEAVGWAIFGNEAARTQKDLIKRHDAPEDAACRVRLAFSFDGKAIEVDRALEGASETPTATVWVDGNVVVRGGPNSSREATGYLTRLLRMESDAFFTSLVARQRELAVLLEMRPAERRQLLLRMLKIESIEDAVRLARERKRLLRELIANLENEASDPKVLDDRLSAARSLLLTAEEEARRCEEALKVSEARLGAARAKRETEKQRADVFAQLHARRRERASLRAVRSQELLRREEEASKAQAAMTEIESLRPVAEAHEAARAEFERLSLLQERARTFEVRARQIGAAEAELSLLRAQAAQTAELVPSIEEAEAILKAARADGESARAVAAEADLRVREARNELIRVANEISSLLERESALRALGPDSPCPTCGRALGTHASELGAALRGERAALESRERDAGAALQAAELSIKQAGARQTALALSERDAERRLLQLRDSYARRAALLDRIRSDEERIRRWRVELGDPVAFDAGALQVAQAAERRSRAAQDRISALQVLASRQEPLGREIATLGKEITRLGQEEAECESALALMAFEPAHYEIAVRAVDELERELRSGTQMLERARAAGQRAKDELGRVQDEIERSRAAAKKLEGSREELSLLEILAGDRDSGLLVRFKDHLAGRVRPLVEAHASRLFQRLTDGRYHGIELSETFDVKVADGDSSFELNRFSGGEQDLAALCLRLAVGQVVAERAGGEGFHVLILDEIFGSQDEGRKANVLESLAQLAETFRQIIVITHIEDVRDRVEHVLRVAEGDDSAVASFES
jgi:exonuclease SbcC